MFKLIKNSVTLKINIFTKIKQCQNKSEKRNLKLNLHDKENVCYRRCN